MDNLVKIVVKGECNNAKRARKSLNAIKNKNLKLANIEILQGTTREQDFVRKTLSLNKYK